MAQEMLDTMHPMSKRHVGTINDGEMMIRRQAVSADKVSAPTLILHAKDDALVNYQHAKQAHEAIKGSQLVLFETVGHFLVPEMERVRQDVREFLKRIC